MNKREILLRLIEIEKEIAFMDLKKAREALERKERKRAREKIDTDITININININVNIIKSDNSSNKYEKVRIYA